jgi:hypothetical protein
MGRIVGLRFNTLPSTTQVLSKRMDNPKIANASSRGINRIKPARSAAPDPAIKDATVRWFLKTAARIEVARLTSKRMSGKLIETHP